MPVPIAPVPSVPAPPAAQNSAPNPSDRLVKLELLRQRLAAEKASNAQRSTETSSAGTNANSEPGESGETLTDLPHALANVRSVPIQRRQAPLQHQLLLPLHPLRQLPMPRQRHPRFADPSRSFGHRTPRLPKLPRLQPQGLPQSKPRPQRPQQLLPKPPPRLPEEACRSAASKPTEPAVAPTSSIVPSLPKASKYVRVSPLSVAAPAAGVEDEAACEAVLPVEQAATSNLRHEPMARATKGGCQPLSNHPI
ncbi:uncharacterized protein BJ171DRAFT_182618 [Polychytrium aggregatum]|uniref:uncharacterized protein n=1 Tax=Polychytrium aggregatum TaxID=110093 RepID=UPI0022FE8D4C|nr:uncharacterized protein BJ171DRAFT_182618 [Polychytrium aggregatum]KAI9202276.1 hypothetical protein BJ171DRAFT_182618 [Polychytrium aggregatum]